MTIYINKTMSDAAQFEAQRIYENLSQGTKTMSAEQTFHLADAQAPDTYAALAGKTVVTLEAEAEGGADIPLQGTYTTVEAVSATYSEPSGLYVVTVIFS